uniref:Alternative protein ELAVL3 n=1 Tax=Homo sapiens TaxID=9606 RepID=L8E8Z0_HUMAN|nr:alternative protein ELAVL3 [Homo sapiens]
MMQTKPSTPSTASNYRRRPSRCPMPDPVQHPSGMLTCTSAGSPRP